MLHRIFLTFMAAPIFRKCITSILFTSSYPIYFCFREDWLYDTRKDEVCSFGIQNSKLSYMSPTENFVAYLTLRLLLLDSTVRRMGPTMRNDQYALLQHVKTERRPAPCLLTASAVAGRRRRRLLDAPPAPALL